MDDKTSNDETETATPARDHDVLRPRLKLDPDLADGEHWTVVDTADQVLEALQLWMDEAQTGEAVTIELTMMSDRDVEELPSI